MSSPQEKKAREFSIDARKRIAPEEEILQSLHNEKLEPWQSPSWDLMGEQGRLVDRLTVDAQNHIKDVIRDLPEKQQFETVKFTNKILRGELDKELGLGKYSPERLYGVDKEQTKEEPNKDQSKDKGYEPEI